MQVPLQMHPADKPVDLRAPGAIDALLAFHKARFGEARMEAEEDADGDGGGSDSEGDSDTGPNRGPGTDANKPVSEMTDAERADYYNRRADRLRDALRSFGNLTPETLRALQEKANKHDELERELMSDKDREIAQVREQERLAATPRVVRAEFKAAAKGVLNAEQLTALLEDRDLTKYVDANGDPDEDKIAKLVTAFAPAQESQDQRRRGPSPVGAGARGSASGPSLSAGADAYARRHGKK